MNNQRSMNENMMANYMDFYKLLSGKESNPPSTVNVNQGVGMQSIMPRFSQNIQMPGLRPYGGSVAPKPVTNNLPFDYPTSLQREY